MPARQWTSSLAHQPSSDVAPTMPLSYLNRRHVRRYVRPFAMASLLARYGCTLALPCQQHRPEGRLCASRPTRSRRQHITLTAPVWVSTLRDRTRHPQANWALFGGTSHSFHDTRSISDVFAGGAPGARTLNPRIKSPLLYH